MFLVRASDAGVRPEQFGERWHAAAADLDRAVDRLADADDRINPLISSRLIGDTFSTGNELKDHALYGVTTEKLVQNEIMPAKDGLAWTRAEA